MIPLKYEEFHLYTEKVRKKLQENDCELSSGSDINLRAEKSDIYCSFMIDNGREEMERWPMWK